MNQLKNILTGIILASFMVSCARSFYEGPNEGPIDVKLKVVAGKDGKVRTPDGNVIGTINEKGKVFDLAGNKIGERKPTTADLFREYQEDQMPYD